MHQCRQSALLFRVERTHGHALSAPSTRSMITWHGARRSSVDHAEGLGHQRRNPACCEGRAGVRARVRLDGRDGGGTIHQIWNSARKTVLTAVTTLTQRQV